MSTVIVGAKGMLGRALREALRARGITPVEVDIQEIDITDLGSVERVLGAHHAKIVINSAAYTAVDAAEGDEATAARVNGDGPRYLADWCKRHGAVLVHYSTDYVFAGNAEKPYRVDQPLEPLGAYGRTKALGEEAIRAAGGEHLIVRTSWLYAPWANNFVRTMVKLTREKPTLKVVNDQRGRPTSAEHLARTTLALLDKHARGTLHVTDGGECTWFEFTREIARLAGHTSCEITPCSTAEFPRPAPRPAYSVLDLGPTEALVGPMPRWQENLADVMARLES